MVGVVRWSLVENNPCSAQWLTGVLARGGAGRSPLSFHKPPPPPSCVWRKQIVIRQYAAVSSPLLTLLLSRGQSCQRILATSRRQIP